MAWEKLQKNGALTLLKHLLPQQQRQKNVEGHSASYSGKR
jgi:hypothetical protein